MLCPLSLKARVVVYPRSVPHRLAEYGWECLTTHGVSPAESYTTTAPCNVLLVALHSDMQGMPLDPTHLHAIRDVLQQVWPTGQDAGYVRTVQTRQALENAVRGMQPHLLYVYGQSTQRGGETYLQFAEGTSISLRQLAALLRNTPPVAALPERGWPGRDGGGAAHTWHGNTTGVLAPCVLLAIGGHVAGCGLVAAVAAGAQ